MHQSQNSRVYEKRSNQRTIFFKIALIPPPQLPYNNGFMPYTSSLLLNYNVLFFFFNFWAFCFFSKYIGPLKKSRVFSPETDIRVRENLLCSREKLERNRQR